MKSILIVSNSIEYADFDIRRDVDTVSFCEMTPMAVAPIIKTRSGETITCNLVDAMEYCFKEDYPSAISIGYINNVDDVYKLMDELDEHPSVPCVFRPRLITDDGDLMVSEEVYNSLMTKILPRVKLLVINKLEAELVAGFECFDVSALKRAMKKIYNFCSCSVLVKPSSVSADFMMFNGKEFFGFGAMQLNVKSLEFTKVIHSLGTACACALGSGADMYDAVCAGIEVYLEGSDVPRNVASAPKTEAEAPVSTPAPQVTSSANTQTTSLVSPVKSLRDKARSLEEKYAINSSMNNEPADEHKRKVVLDLMQAAATEKEKQEQKEKELESKNEDALDTLRSMGKKLSSM